LPNGIFVDHGRFKWLLVPLWVLSPAISIYLALNSGNTAWYWFTFAFLYVAFPVLDAVLGEDGSNPPESAEDILANDPYYKLVLAATVPCHYITFLTGAWAIGTHNLDGVAYAGIALSVGSINGFGVATAHELGHKRSKPERWLAKFCLAIGFYGAYMVDHNRGHHKDVATPEDSGSARFGENFYRFVLRQVPHSTLVRPWRLEAERLARKGLGPWTLENEVLQPALISTALFGALIAVYGVVVIPYLVVTAAIMYLFLAFADFAEHYGLLRQKMPDGRYERVRPEHSWNTNHIASNIPYWHVQRHSDHHARPTRYYQVLKSYDGLPSLPSGYPAMLLISLIPALWRKVMHPRVLAVYGGDITKVNIDPGQRVKLLRRYGAPVQLEPAHASPLHPAPATTRDETAPPASGCFRCPGCGYTYDERCGHESQGFAPGTPWSAIPATWACPDCSVRDKVDFVRVDNPKVAAATIAHSPRSFACD